MSEEKVNGPAHYGGKDNPHEVIKCLEAWGLDKDAYLFNVAKYIARAGKKPGAHLLEDFKKAEYYLRRRIVSFEGEKNAPPDPKILHVTDLNTIQREHAEWSRRNFPGSIGKPMHPFLGMVEEVGELAHAILKGEQGIRGTAEEHEAASQDAIGDELIFLLDYCTKRGWNAGDILAKTWAQVKQRDWTKNKADGTSA